MIEIKNLNFSYKTFKRGSGIAAVLHDLFYRQYYLKRALIDINLTINKGEIVGLLGMNGAGKTTLIKCLVGLLKYKEGSIKVNGFVPYEKDKRLLKNIGVVIGQKSQLIWDLPPKDTFDLLKTIYDVSDDDYEYRLQLFVENLRVEEQLYTPVRKLSLGERMKFELIASLLHYPKLLILDEPTIGLDIISQKNIRDFIKKLNSDNNVTVIITSHNMEDIKDLCSKLVILKSGRVVFDDKIEKLMVRDREEVYRIEVTTNSLIETHFTNYKFFKDDYKYVFEISSKEVGEILNIINLNNIQYLDLKIEKIPFEEIIFKYFEESED